MLALLGEASLDTPFYCRVWLRGTCVVLLFPYHPPVGSFFLDTQVVVSVTRVAPGTLQSHESMLTGSALVYQGFALALRNSEAPKGLKHTGHRNHGYLM